MGISCSALCPEDNPIQLDFMGDEAHRMKCEQMEQAIDGLRRRFGHQVLQRCVVMTDRQFADINPVDDHTVHPVPFFAG